MTEKDKMLKDIATLNVELRALMREQEFNRKFGRSCEKAIDFLYGEIRLLDLVEFCNTGKYPDDAR